MSTKNTKRLFCDNELFGIESTFHFRSGDRCLTEDILKRHSKVMIVLLVGYTLQIIVLQQLCQSDLLVHSAYKYSVCDISCFFSCEWVSSI